MDTKHLDIFWGTQFRRRKPADVSRNQFLKSIPFFENLTEKQLKVLALRLHQRDYEENEYLFEVNHPGAALFIISRGEVVIETSSHIENKAELAKLHAGEFLGELALLDDSPRSASARALKPTSCYSLFRGDLNRLAKEEPAIATEIFRALAWVIGERLRAKNRQVTPVKKVG